MGLSILIKIFLRFGRDAVEENGYGPGTNATMFRDMYTQQLEVQLANMKNMLSSAQETLNSRLADIEKIKDMWEVSPSVLSVCRVAGFQCLV